MKCTSWEMKTSVPLVMLQRQDERLHGVDVQVRGRLVHQEQIRRIDEELDQVQPRLFSPPLSTSVFL